MTWSVRGIDDEAREAALVAARQSGKSVGEWLNSVIREQADRGGAERGQPRRETGNPQHAIETRLAELADRLTRLTERRDVTAAPRFEPGDTSLDEIALELDRHLDRPMAREPYREPDRRGDALARSIADLERRVRDLGNTVAQPARPAPAPARPTASLSMLDAAIADIRRRQGMLEPERTPPQFQRPAAPPPPTIQTALNPVQGLDVEHHFRDLASRLDEIGARTATPPADHLAPLHDDLRRIEAMLSGLRPEPMAPLVLELERLRAAVTAQSTEPHFKALAAGQAMIADRLDQLDAGRQTHADEAERAEILRELAALRRDLDPRPIASTLGGIDHKLGTLGHRLDQLVARRPDDAAFVSQIRAELLQAGGHEVIARVDQRLGDVATRLDAIESGAAQRPLFERLITDVAHLVASVEQMKAAPAGRGEESLGPVLDSLDAIAQRLDNLEASRQSVRDLGPANAGEAALQALAAQIEDLSRKVTAPAPPPAPVSMQGVTPDLIARLDRIAHHLDAAESKLSSLDSVGEIVHELRSALADRSAAPDTARAVAREAVAEFASLAREVGPDQAIAGLIDELRQLRDTSRGLEQRTIEGLQSVQDALTALLPHLSSRAPEAEMSWPEDERRSGRERRTGSAAAAPRPVLRPAAEETRPLEPGSGRPAVAQPVQVPVIAETEFEPEPSTTAATAPVSRRADFIAAARRAAQAAQSAQNAQAQVRPATANARPVDPADPEEPSKPSALSRIGAALKGRGKPIAMVAAALILAALVAEIPASTWDRMVSAARTSGPEVATTAVDSAQDIVGSIPSATEMQALSAPVGPTTSFSQQPTPPQDGVFTPAPSVSAPPPSPPGPQARLEQPPASVAPAASPTNAGEPWPMPPERIGSAALRTAATQGDARAAFEIGLRYADGRGVPADGKAATEWYRRAAIKGFVPAQYRLGSAYEKGLAGSRDTTEAKRWYQLAAEAGSVRAMHNLGVLFANDRDMTTALPWFQKAADLGLKDSQFNLGIVYALGSGVKQDLAVSYKWFSLAGDQGDGEAAKKRDDIAQYLDRTTLAAAKMAVDTWRARTVDKAANDETTGWTETASAQPAAPTDPVSRAQALMKAQGLYTGAIDGQASPATKTAVKAAQKKAGLKQTGEIDDALIRALTAPARAT